MKIVYNTRLEGLLPMERTQSIPVGFGLQLIYGDTHRRLIEKESNDLAERTYRDYAFLVQGVRPGQYAEFARMHPCS